VIIEPDRGDSEPGLVDRVHARLQAFAETELIDTVLQHPSLPVDIRHNAKIRRPRLAAWAGRKRRTL